VDRRAFIGTLAGGLLAAPAAASSTGSAQAPMSTSARIPAREGVIARLSYRELVTRHRPT